MQDNFEEHIKEKLLGNSLTPSENVWNHIEDELRKNDGFEIKLNHKIGDLELGNLNHNVWQKIEVKLNKKRKRSALLWIVLAIGTASACILTLSKFEPAENNILVEQKTKPSHKVEVARKEIVQHISINALNKTQEKSKQLKVESNFETAELTALKFKKSK